MASTNLPEPALGPHEDGGVTADGDRHRRLSGGAFWAMMRRIVLLAGCTDALFLLVYGAMDAWVLAWLNLPSIAMYVAAWWLIGRRRNRLALSLVWLEVLVHATVGSLLIGWDSAFHYFLLLFIPTLVVGAPRSRALPLFLLLLAVYAGLWAACRAWAPLAPLTPLQLAVATWVNIVVVFVLFYSVARFYRARVLSAERQLLALATVDPLTKLANRKHFDEAATAALAWARREGRPLTLVLADIDHFKQINDSHGHDAGDQLLVAVAQTLRRTVRTGDTVARWGGEEFIVLLQGADANDARALAERLRDAVQKTRVVRDGQTLGATLSFGLCTVPPDGREDLQAATRRADRALYASKAAGRNRVTHAEDLPPSGGPAGHAEPAANDAGDGAGSASPSDRHDASAVLAAPRALAG